MEIILTEIPHLRLAVTLMLVAVVAVTVMNLADWISAMVTSKVVGQKIESAKCRHAMFKLLKYHLIMMAFMVFDLLALLVFYTVPYATIIAGLVIAGIEILSMFEHGKRRKDRTAKIPEVLADVVSYLGEDRFKELVMDLAKRKLTGEEV